MTMKITPRTLSGVLHTLNKNACDWGWQGMLAYGSQNLVVILDPNTMQMIQVLGRHKGYVVNVKWSKQTYHHDLGSPYNLRLASADYNGTIIVHDVKHGSTLAEFSENSRPIADMNWLSAPDGSRDLLAVLHPPYSFVLWNADTGTRIWKKAYTELLHSFAFDPFDCSRVAFRGQDCILFLDDFSINKIPATNGKKFYISSPGSASNTGGERAEKRNASTLTRRMTNIIVGEPAKKSQPEEEQTSINECLQLVYHQACRHHIILLYSKEILILDLQINQTVGIIPLERSSSPFVQVLSIRQRDVLMCLHENGSISVRVRHRNNANTASSMSTQQHDDNSSQLQSTQSNDISYDLRCQSDQLRVTKNTRVFGISYCPVNENQVALTISDSRVLLWKLHTVTYQNTSEMGGAHLPPTSPLFTPGLETISEHHTIIPHPKLALCDMIDESQSFVNDRAAHGRLAHGAAVGQPTPDKPSQHGGRGQQHGVSLKFVLSGLANGVASPVSVVKMCPPLTTKNWNVYQPLLAIGSTTGIIQVYNLSTGTLSKEYSTHSTVVRGIEWVSLHSFLSFSNATPSTNGLTRNELMLTEIQTGRSIPLRTNREEEAPMVAVKVSYLKQYFVVMFKEKPFEIWDLKTLMLIRLMRKNFPIVTALEWSPPHNAKTLKKKLSHDGTAANTETSTQGGGSVSTSVGGSVSTTSVGADVSTPVGGGVSTSVEGGASSISGSSSGHSEGQTPATPTASDSMSRSESKSAVAASREHFVFTDTSGMLYHFMVEGSFIKEGSRIPPDGGMSSISCIAWKAETMVLGDVEGNLNLWDLKARVSRALPTHRGLIKKLKFAPGRGNMKLLVMYIEGCDVWDVKEVKVVSSVRCPRELPKVLDIDWAASDKPILACADGCVRVMDIEFKHASSYIEDHYLPGNTFSPHLLTPKAALALKSLLQHQPWRDSYTLSVDAGEDNADIADVIKHRMQLIDRDLQEFLPLAPHGTAQRCLLVSRLFGDETELHFWTVALFYLRMHKSKMLPTILPRSTSSITASDLFIPNTPDSDSSATSNNNAEQQQQQKSGTKDAGNDDQCSMNDSPTKPLTPTDDASCAGSTAAYKPLETCYDLVQDNLTFQRYELERLSLHDSKRASYDQTSRCAESLQLLGHTDRAVQLLLETDSDSSNYYVDSLRACLVASIRSSGASQSTIKLVATNLIANGKLSEGVQLLCLIDKGLDACRYLQTYGSWFKATWLAKCTLSYSECGEVMKRWADHLSSPSVNQKSKSLLVLLSLGQYERVLELLCAMRHFDTAVLFIEACREHDALQPTAKTDELCSKAYVEYARIQVSLGNRRAAEYYCKKAGQDGEQLYNDIQNIFS